MQTGLHVLTEKLMGYSVPICKEMGRVAKQQDKLLATGHQRHYSVLYDNAVDCIRQGLLGDVHCIRAQWHRQGRHLVAAGAGDCTKAIRTWPRQIDDTKKKLDAAKPDQIASLQKLLASR